MARCITLQYRYDMRNTDMVAKQQTTSVSISAPRIETATFRLIGTSPLVQARFSAKAKQMMMDKMAAGSTSKGKKVREARDFDQDCLNAMHIGVDGQAGVPAGAFRNAMISACRLVGFKMTLAKLSVFVQADTFDAVDGVPLVHLNGKWERLDMHTRNATGVVDIRVRPMWREWWIDLRVQFDAEQFTLTDVSNLLMRAGVQVGIGEGRHDSKSSTGLGFGCFRLGEVT
jgi:hypothetical protein